MFSDNRLNVVISQHTPQMKLKCDICDK